jgi:hypothetical protein
MTLLVITTHLDDEAFGVARILARRAAAKVCVALISVTRIEVRKSAGLEVGGGQMGPASGGCERCSWGGCGGRFVLYLALEKCRASQAAGTCGRRLMCVVAV